MFFTFRQVFSAMAVDKWVFVVWLNKWKVSKILELKLVTIWQKHEVTPVLFTLNTQTLFAEFSNTHIFTGNIVCQVHKHQRCTSS